MSRGRVVGLLGCGRWGSNVLRDLRSLGCEVRVADPDPAARARAVGAVEVVADVGSMGPCDGYVVATPASTHAAVVRAVLLLGRPVFVEKPFTTDAAEAVELAAAGAGLVSVMEKWRYHPAVGLLQELAGSGTLGPLVEVRTRRWSTFRSQADVGAEWTLLPHDLSVLDELVGPLVGVTSASSVAAGGTLRRLSGTVSGTAPASFDVWDAAPAPERSVVVVGQDATATWSSSDESVVVVVGRDGAAARRTPVPPAELPLLAELREFVGHLCGGPAPRCSAEVGARTVVMVEQALRRAAQQEPAQVVP